MPGDTGGVNFLAHLVLAPDTPEGMVGALAPDLIRGPLPSALDPAVLAAAREHQSIDRATDAHPAFLTLRNRLQPAAGRFASIVADVFLDHALSSAWQEHGRPEPIHAYTARVADTFTRQSHRIPSAMQDPIARLIRYHWLDTYATADGIGLTLQRMSARYAKRLGIAVDLSPAADLLGDSAPPAWLTDAFAQLWPDLLQHASRFRASAASPPIHKTPNPLASTPA